MHAVLITFQSAPTVEHAEPSLVDYAQSLGAMPGLVCATWMVAGARSGSFQVFADRPAAEQYLGGSIFRKIKTNPAFSDFEIRHFEVIDGLNRFLRSDQIMPLP